MTGGALLVASALFAVSIAGLFINRNNIIIVLMCVELLLLAVNTSFLAFSSYLGNLHGAVFVFFILAVAAAESAIGLAILVLVFRTRGGIAVDTVSELKG